MTVVLITHNRSTGWLMDLFFKGTPLAMFSFFLLLGDSLPVQSAFCNLTRLAQLSKILFLGN